MADHDRDAGSRGEEEAPRDPTPGEHDGEGRSRYRYGEAPPGPGYAPPPTMPMAAPSRPGSYREFFRQKQAQVIGAGLVGLALGALLGGGAVAVVSDFGHRDDARVMHQGYPGWGPGLRYLERPGMPPPPSPPPPPPVPIRTG